MTLSGPFSVYRWCRPDDDRDQPFVLRGPALTKLFDLPEGAGHDFAEGLEVIDWHGRKAALIVYDRPGPERVGAGATYVAGVFELA